MPSGLPSCQRTFSWQGAYEGKPNSIWDQLHHLKDDLSLSKGEGKVQQEEDGAAVRDPVDSSLKTSLTETMGSLLGAIKPSFGQALEVWLLPLPFLTQLSFSGPPAILKEENNWNL